MGWPHGMYDKPSSTSSRRAPVLCVLVALVLLGMGLRLYGLDADSLWLDEILTADKAQLDLPSLLSLVASGEREATTHTYPPV